MLGDGERSLRPIPPNGHSLIRLTGAQGGNELCYLYTPDLWLTSLPHLPPPSWPGNDPLLRGEERAGRVVGGAGDVLFEWESSDTAIGVLSTQISL